MRDKCLNTTLCLFKHQFLTIHSSLFYPSPYFFHFPPSNSPDKGERKKEILHVLHSYYDPQCGAIKQHLLSGSNWPIYGAFYWCSLVTKEFGCTYMYIIPHTKVIFFTLIVLPFKQLYYVNLHVISWSGSNFKDFRQMKGTKMPHICELVCIQKHYLSFSQTTRCQPKLKNGKKLCIRVLVSSVPDGVLHNPASEIVQPSSKVKIPVLIWHV